MPKTAAYRSSKTPPLFPLLEYTEYPSPSKTTSLDLSQSDVFLASSNPKLATGISILPGLFLFNTGDAFDGPTPPSSPPFNDCDTCLSTNDGTEERDSGGGAVAGLQKTGDIFLGDGVNIGELTAATAQCMIFFFYFIN